MIHQMMITEQITDLVKDAKLKYEAYLDQYRVEPYAFGLYPFNWASEDGLNLFFGCLVLTPDECYNEDRLVLLEVNIESPKVKHTLQEFSIPFEQSAHLLELYEQC